MTGFLAPLMFAGWAAAGADKDCGVPVTVRVVDAASEQPIASAVVRNRSEQDRRRVNTETGQWSDCALYLPDGTELLIEKGMTLEFEISAPGYTNQSISYLVRRRKNLISVHLTEMVIDMSDEDPDDIVIQFGRDKPID